MTIGSQLRAEREQQGFDLPAMADYLRIRLPYLQSIENDAFAELPPGNAYRIGFIKSYAAALNLDVDEMVALFHKEQDSAQKIPLRVRMPLKDGQDANFAMIGLLVVLLAAGAIAWMYLHHSDRSLAEDVPAVPDRLQAKPAIPVVAAAAPTGESGEPDEARDETYNHATAQTVAPRAAVAEQPAAARELNDAQAVSRVEIVAVADSWVQIHDASGTAVYTGVMHTGDMYKIPDQPGWTMTAGNAGGVSLAIDGKQGAPLGQTGEVIRDLALSDTAVAGHP